MPPVLYRCICLQLRKKLVGHRYGVSAVQFSPNGRYLVSCSWDDSIGLWDVQAATLIGWLHGHSSPVANAIFLEGGNILVRHCLSVCLSVRLSVCLSVCPSVCLFVFGCPSVHLSVHPSPSHPLDAGQLFLGRNCAFLGPVFSLHPTGGNRHTHSSS